jgi:RND family efflux transporter MFP subunit
MISRHSLLWRGVGFVLLAGTLSGCNPPPPMAETPPPPVTVSQAVAREVIDQDDYEGRIGAVETFEVRARVRGYLVKVNFEAGQMVKAGDLLYEIDPKPYKVALEGTEAVKLAADAALEFARSELNRTKVLAGKGAASREEVETWAAKQVVAQGEVAKAQAAVDRAKLDLGYTTIKSPITGKISRTQVTLGNLINTGGGETLLSTVVTVDPMYVYFDVDERALLRYRTQFRKGKKEEGPIPPIKDLKIPVEVAVEGEEGYPHHGFLDFADNQVKSSTGTIEVRGALPNPKRDLSAGMRARVRIPVSDSHEVLMVTERAVGNDQGRKFLYVVNDQNLVERRDVRLGRVIDGMQIVQGGLKKEDWVIVNGIQRVRDAMKVDPKRGPMPGGTAPADAAAKPAKNGAKRADAAAKPAKNGAKS